MTFLQCKDFYTSPDFCTPGVGRYANAILARLSHKFEPAVCTKRLMYTKQTGRIQIFDQLSAHYIKTASFSMAKSFVKYCLVYSARKYNI